MEFSFGVGVTGQVMLSCLRDGCCRCRSFGVDEGHEFSSLCEEFLLLTFQFMKELVLCCSEESGMFL